MTGAGDLDRRIEIELGTKSRDASQDEIITWATAFKRWAGMKQSSGREFMGAAQVIRDADTVWTIRYDSESRTIAPESHRVRYGGAIFEIVGIAEATEGRKDYLLLLTSSRPDLVGARGRDTTSDGSP